jgi:hypothetical protein
MTTKYIDSETFENSFLKKYTNNSLSNQLLADTFHDEINVLKKVQPKKSTFDDNLINNSENNNKKLNKKIIDIKDNFNELVYANLDKKESLEIEEKKKSELFVVDVFSGSYQIMGINNLLDCTANQKAENIKAKLNTYDENSPTFKYSNIFNCDKLLFSYFKNNINEITDNKELTDFSGDKCIEIYNILVNCFWKKLIEIVEFFLNKDKDILNQDYAHEDLTTAIDILKNFRFNFDTDNFKLYLYISGTQEKSAEWIPTQKSLAKKIIDLCKSKNPHLLAPNVKQREGENSKLQDECINAIESYSSGKNAKIKILVLSLCKFLGDTSHIVMTYILLSEIKNDINKMNLSKNHDEEALKELEKLKKLKINLQLSERPMLIRNCLPDNDFLEKFNIDETNLSSLIILVKKMAVINKLKGEIPSSYTDNKICWSYTIDPDYNRNLYKNFLISLITKLIEKKNIIKKFEIKNDKIIEIKNDKIINIEFLEDNKINIKFLEDFKKELEIKDLDKIEELYKIAPILKELNNLCIAYEIYNIKDNIDREKIETILEKMNNLMMNNISKLFELRQSKIILWDHICTIQSNADLILFEDLLNYNQSIKLLRNPEFFKGDETLKYYKNNNLSSLEKAIKSEKNDELGFEFKPAKNVTATNYKLQITLRHIIDIIDDKDGGSSTKRGFEEVQENTVENIVKYRVENTVKDIFELYIDELLTDITEYINSLSSKKIINEHKIIYIAIFIEHRIDIFIYNIEDYINLNFYFDSYYLKIKIDNIFGDYSDKIYQIILNKIKLYLYITDLYKNEEYGDFDIGLIKTEESSLIKTEETSLNKPVKMQRTNIKLTDEAKAAIEILINKENVNKMMEWLMNNRLETDKTTSLMETDDKEEAMDVDGNFSQEVGGGREKKSVQNMNKSIVSKVRSKKIFSLNIKKYKHKKKKSIKKIKYIKRRVTKKRKHTKKRKPKNKTKKRR